VIILLKDFNNGLAVETILEIGIVYQETFFFLYFKVCLSIFSILFFLFFYFYWLPTTSYSTRISEMYLQITSPILKSRRLKIG
jgi:uncharacterized protein YggT (Ycf19 family)